MFIDIGARGIEVIFFADDGYFVVMCDHDGIRVVQSLRECIFIVKVCHNIGKMECLYFFPGDIFLERRLRSVVVAIRASVGSCPSVAVGDI